MDQRKIRKMRKNKKAVFRVNKLLTQLTRSVDQHKMSKLNYKLLKYQAFSLLKSWARFLQVQAHKA